MTDTLVRMRAAPLFAVAALAVVAPRRSLAQVPVQAPVQAPAQAPLTLDDVLQAARAANARVPIAARNVRIAQARLQEAQGRLYPRLLFDGDLHNGLPQRYATGDARFQMVGVDTLFSPALRASRTIAEFGVRSAAAGYQVAERLIAYDVRVWYSQYRQAERELAFRHEGIEKLQDYLVRVRSLRAAGQGVAADVVSTEARHGAGRRALGGAPPGRRAGRAERADGPAAERTARAGAGAGATTARRASARPGAGRAARHALRDAPGCDA